VASGRAGRMLPCPACAPGCTRCPARPSALPPFAIRLRTGIRRRLPVAVHPGLTACSGIGLRGDIAGFLNGTAAPGLRSSRSGNLRCPPPRQQACGFFRELSRRLIDAAPMTETRPRQARFLLPVRGRSRRTSRLLRVDAAQRPCPKSTSQPSAWTPGRGHERRPDVPSTLYAANRQSHPSQAACRYR